MYRLLFRFFALFALLAAFASSQLLAQAATGRFSGTVTDPDGNAIPGASVQVLNQDTLTSRSTKTDDVGAYQILALPAGRYQVIVESEGFERRSSGILKLSAGQDVVFNARLTLTHVETKVEVSGGAGETVIETDTASLSTTLGQQGVSNQTGQDEAKVGVAGSAKFSVNGGRVEYNTFSVDGSDVLNTSINASRGQGEPLMVYPSIDAIQDMKVLTADYSALYGKSASGSVLVSTKSGTDKFHGNVYGFVRNEMFNARNYFDQPDPIPLGYTGKRTYRTPLYRRIDAGATFGGPLYIPGHYNINKTRTFFFFSEEVRREKTPVDYNQAVPTAAERKGDFTDVCPTLTPGTLDTFDPSAYPDCPQGPISSVNQKTEVGRTVSVNYTSSAILNTGLIPLPNSTSGCNSTNPTALAHCYVASVSPATH